MSKIIESKIKKLQELQRIENNFHEAIEAATNNLIETYNIMAAMLPNVDKSAGAIIKEHLKRIDNAIKELNGTRFERKNKVENEAIQPAKQGRKA